MSILLSICGFIVIAIIVILYAATNKLIKHHNELHAVDDDNDLDLPKTL